MRFRWMLGLFVLGAAAVEATFRDSWSAQQALLSSLDTPMNDAPLDVANHAPLVTLEPTWKVLGPFQIGTREATWGSDPLDCCHYGGFSAIQNDRPATFPSTLTANGSVAWREVRTRQETRDGGDSVVAKLSVGFGDVDWGFLQSVYGWAALQWQAWARIDFSVVGAEGSVQRVPVLVFTEGVLEFVVDGVRYFGGDYYSYGKAPLVLELGAGVHRLEVRLVRDVRVVGGAETADLEVSIEFRRASGTLEFGDGELVVPDVVDGLLASSLGSVGVRNTAQSDLTVVAIEDMTGEFSLSLPQQEVILRPGQSRPIAFDITHRAGDSGRLRLRLDFDAGGGRQSITQEIHFKRRSKREPHKFTFKHPSGIVSYAVLRPPSKKAVSCSRSSNAERDKLPVLLALHGAGVEADSRQVTDSLSAVPDLPAWTLFPSGVTPWSGDDWHDWGFADVEAAVSAIPDWIKDVEWLDVGVDADKWFVTGHSNGGQGTWYALTHRPDKVRAAAPVSGYSSIQAYVPFELWQPLDPWKRAVLEVSLAGFRHELLASNGKGTPIYQQHGSLDDNVPAFHSRAMRLALLQAGANTTYMELPGAGHYFDGVMTTPGLREFYNSALHDFGQVVRLTEFTITVASPAEMGPMQGIQVTHLEVPGRYGSVEVKVTHLDDETCLFDMKTSNVLSFKLDASFCHPASVEVDGGKVNSIAVAASEHIFWKSASSWVSIDATALESRAPRRPSQSGTMSAILRSWGPFRVMHEGDATYDTALQITRNLFQYFSADSILSSSLLSDHGKSTGNIITVAVGEQLATGDLFPIQIMAGSEIYIRDRHGNRKTYAISGLAAIFLAPQAHDSDGLQLVVWGAEAEDAAWAARLVPMLTGVGQPDFVILDTSKSRWQGAGGVLAMGFFDHQWEVADGAVMG